ncbi:MAG: BON domain-containing protein [Rhodocyclaceae bacterium]|nr:BON domain-containing protein [Rhodocyclaceae bacterium]
MNLPVLLLLIAAILPALSGCVPAVAVGATTAAFVISDRRQPEAFLADEGIELRASNRINEKFPEKVHVNVTSYNRMALLTGEVPDEATSREIEKIVSTVPMVKTIINELQVSGLSSLAGRATDAFLTSKIKARFLDHNQFSPTKVKVVTEAGTAFLIGIVTNAEATTSVDIARTTGGVLKVVRVFDIISDEEARRLDGTKPPPPSIPASLSTKISTPAAQ